ncbi:MAG: SGNH/GDSL hydrolase family protein [Clostridia bacterium]|nr:SGNH/GDSL hydrolase family protein [Clostridia bacterium]
MNKFLCPDPNEKPLEHIPTDGGYCGIFRTITLVGDSLSSGEMESTKPDGSKGFHDFYDYSWGNTIGRMCASRVNVFARGGMTAKEYCDSYADSRGYWNREYAAQCYIIALAVNDLLVRKWELGSIEDVDFDDWHNNKDTYAGNYAKIIQRYKEISPDAKFFLMTLPYETPETTPWKCEIADRQAELLHQLAEKFSNCYVLDLRKYAPVYDQSFRDTFFLGGHMSPVGYIYTARLVVAYIDYIVRHNFEDFRQVAFIGTPYRNRTYDKEDPI